MRSSRSKCRSKIVLEDTKYYMVDEDHNEMCRKTHQKMLESRAYREPLEARLREQSLLAKTVIAIKKEKDIDIVDVKEEEDV